MSDKYSAYKYYDDVQWGVVDQEGGILIEAAFDSLEVAAYVAKRFSDNDDLTWEDIEADVAKLEAKPPADAGGPVPSAFAQAAQGDDALAVALYEAAVLNTVVDDLQRQLVDARAERDAAVETVNKAHKVLQDVERWLPTTENFDLGAHYYSEVHSAWKAGSWIRNYWLHLSEQAAQASDQK